MSNFFSNSLPNQVVSYKRKKNDKLAKDTVDTLERIASKQLREDAHLNDYYKMFEGRLVWADYSGEDLKTLEGIQQLMVDDTVIPSFVKHYDLIGVITNQLVGEWLSNKEDFIVDCVDEYTKNEFLRERENRLNEYTRSSFDLEVKKRMAELGISEQGEFQSEEEQQAYMQQIQEIQNSIKTPDEIEREMKSWKTQAVSWSNATMEQDYVRYSMEDLDRTEMTDYVLTGRWFRNYHVGYDHYKPERWDVRHVFFSRDEDATNPQDREYVGRQYRESIYRIRERWGHLFTPKELEYLNNFFGQQFEGEKNYHVNSTKGIQEVLFGNNEQLPFYNFNDYEKAIEMQDAFGIPMGENIVKTDEGEERIPYYLSNEFNFATNPNVRTRGDYNVRTDTVLVTEGYYRSSKRMYLVRYTDASGVDTVDTFTEDLLPEFVKEYGLKRDRTTPLYLIQEKLEKDTIYTFDLPVVRQFVKINVGTVGKNKAIYFDDEMPFQIKGNSDLFDVKIPVGGIIDSNFIANKIRPYQIMYNICLNQIANMMEKELGLFFLFDVNLLPSEYKTYGDTEDALHKMQEFIRSTSLAPIDTAKQNTQQTQPMANTFMAQNLSYTNEISGRLNWAEYYKRMAIEQIGMTPQRLGSPNQYETAEGVRQGVEASYAQTEDKFSKMSSSRLKAIELHLAIAQYCQKEYLDQDFVFSRSDGSRAFIHLSDPDFPLRRIGVMPINDSNKRNQRERLVNAMMQLNTLGSDIEDYAQVFLSKSTQEVLQAGKNANRKRLQETEAQRAHEQELVDKQLQAQAQKEELERMFKASEAEKERIKDIKIAELQALARTSTKDGNEPFMQSIRLESEEAIKQQQLDDQREFNNNSLTLKENVETKRLEMQKEEMELKKEELRQKDRRVNADILIAQTNKN